jgi:hypothetical protein
MRLMAGYQSLRISSLVLLPGYRCRATLVQNVQNKDWIYMIIPRVYKPAAEEILYHYCDASAFHAICTNKKMRFSDLFTMNDFMEMHWGYQIWEQAATELLDEVGRDFLDEIDKLIHSSGFCGLPTASCFSLDGDVLSQWRAYADDGRGYVIGFSAKDLLELPVRPLRVLYNEEMQVKELKNIVKALHEVEQSEETKFGNDFNTTCYTLAFDLAAYKNPAFAEEQEVRLIHLLDFERSNDSLSLKDIGGQAFGKACAGSPVSFRMRDNIPVAFIELDFTDDERINPIKEVIIGPKNNVLPTAISIFLETIEIGSVRVKKSKASYR